MKTILVAALALLSVPAFATVRVYSPNMSCADIQDTVNSNGAAIVYYGPHLYERVVAHHGYCASGPQYIIRPFYVSSVDQDSCFAGYICQENNGH